MYNPVFIKVSGFQKSLTLVFLFSAVCSFNTEGYLGPIRYTVLKDAFNMPFSVNFSVKAGDGAKIALSENGTDDSIFTEIFKCHKGTLHN